MNENLSICYIGFDLMGSTKFNEFVKEHDHCVIICPESLRNGKQIIEWVSQLHEEKRIFATNSLFLLRELYLQEVPVLFRNILEDEAVMESTNIDEIGKIEILDRELEQSDRYIDHEIKIVPLDSD